MRNVLAKLLTQTLLMILVLSLPYMAAGQNPPDSKSTTAQNQAKDSAERSQRS
jgi:hypothetical protein